MDFDLSVVCLIFSGPLIGKLKNEESVTLPDETVVRSSTLCQ